MRHILIPTDFSDNAKNALLYAVELFSNIPSTFHIVNIYDVGVMPLLTTISSHKIGMLYDQEKKVSQRELDRILEEIKSYKPSEVHDFNTISESGDLIDRLRNIIDTKSIDLIIMGTQGATGAEFIFMGSTTKKVIKAISECPVIAVPKDFRFHKMTDIGFATDFRRIYYRSEVQPIINITKTHQSMLRMIEVFDEPKLTNVQQYNYNALEEYFKNIHYEFHVIPNFSTITKGIKTVIEELELDMIVMINYKHSFIEKILREPIIKKMIFYTTIPLMIIPADT